MELTPDLRKALDESGESPLLVVDARTQQTYVMVRSEVYGRLIGGASSKPALGVPEGIRLAKAALQRDLPELLANRRTRGQYICYRRDQRVAVGKGYREVIAEVVRLAIPEEEYIVAKVEPGAGSDEEEEIDRTFVESEEKPDPSCLSC